VYLLKPSYATGYAKNASQSAHPNLWDGLVGAWMPSLGVTGETLRDVSGNGNHGTLGSGMIPANKWITTEKSWVLDFDGFNDTIYCENSKSLRVGDGSFTVWFNSRINDTDVYRIIENRGPGLLGTVAGWQISWNGSWSNTLVDSGSGAYVKVDPSDTSLNVLNDNQWHHGVMIWDRPNQDLLFYVDGKKVEVSLNKSGTVNSFINSYRLHIGSHATGQYLSGQISSCGISNRILSPSEIKQLYVDSLAPFRKKQRVSVAVPSGIQFKPYWAKQSTQISGLLK